MISALTHCSSPPRIRRPLAVTLVAFSAWLVSQTAFAQVAAPVGMHWEAPSGCPQQRDVQERIRKLTGAAGSTPGALQADGTITQSDDGRFHLKLVMRSGSLLGERNIDSKACADLAGAAAVTIALLMRSLSEGQPDGLQTPATATDSAPGEAESRKQAEQARQAEEARAKAASARKAGSSVTGAPGSGQASRSIRTEQSMREQLEEAYDSVTT
jgi:hypothetical protein